MTTFPMTPLGMSQVILAALSLEDEAIEKKRWDSGLGVSADVPRILDIALLKCSVRTWQTCESHWVYIL